MNYTNENIEDIKDNIDIDFPDAGVNVYSQVFILVDDLRRMKISYDKLIH